ncbi:MAG: hypothetical protein JSV36_18745 [Anaerolineae bacterium]|nr:MAG: hypothetical protein JSV36_18745 [Anaerolineae bacterium]
MSAPLEADVSQVRLSGGRRSATSAVAHLAVRDQRRRGQKWGMLHVLATVEDDADEVIARAIAEAVKQAFQRLRGSLTARLRQAVQAGSAVLLQDNLDLVARSPRSGGVVCAVLRDGDLYLGQAGTAVACVWQRGALSRVPEEDQDEASLARAFGRRRDPDVRLTYQAVGPGDAVMFADRVLLRAVSEEDLAQALSFANVGLSVERLAEVLTSGEGALMVLAMRQRDAPVSLPATEYSGRTPARAERISGAGTQDRPFGYTQDRPPDEVYADRIEPPGLAGPSPRERLIALREVVGTGLGALGRVAGDWLRRLTPGEEGPYRGRRRPVGRKLRRQATGTEHSAWRPIALILPLVVIVLAALAYWKRGWDRQVRYDALMGEVERQLEIAATTDEAAARQALETALTTLDEAADIPPQKEAVSMLQADVQRQLDVLNKVVRLDGVQHLYIYPPAGQVDQIVVHGADIYVLDRLMDRIYHHRLNEGGTALESDEERLLVRRGDQPDNSTAVGELVGMAWMPAGEGRQTGALLILGRNGLLLAHDPTWERLVGTMLPASESWQYPVDVSSYRGRFYVLDPGLSQILRYRAGGAGYDSPPEPYFPEGEVDLVGAIGMAIDGFVYLLFEDGRLEKYLSGEPVPLTLNLADQPLQQPSAIYAAPDAEARFLYVADPFTGRVLRCDKGGQMIQQFILQDDDAFSRVQDIFVDEVGSQLYFLSGNRLLMASIPPP